MIMSSLVIFIYLGAILSSVSLVGAAQANGAFSGSLSRSIAGGSTSTVSAFYLTQYTNLDSFLSACANGTLGFSGFVFIGGLVALLATWVSNLFEYRKVIL